MVERIRYNIKIACGACGAQGMAGLAEDDFPYGGVTCRSTEWVSEGFRISDVIRCADCKGAVDEIEVSPSSRERPPSKNPSGSAGTLAQRRSRARLEPV